MSKNLGKNNIISVSIIYYILKKNSYKTYKPTIKLGLIKAIKEARYI
jgi:hypothetical protein